MKIEYRIVASAEGTLDEVIAMEGCTIGPFPEMDEVLGTLRNLAFIVEMSPFLKDNRTAQNTVKDANRILTAFRGD